jgi:hypothetical protein
MRFLILNTDYPEFLGWLYAQHPDLGNRPYQEQMRLRYESLYGVADFYSSNLRALGHEAEDVYANNEGFQTQWAVEAGLSRADVEAASRSHAPLRNWMKQVARNTGARDLLLHLRSWFPRRPALPRRLYRILEAQIRRYRPDVLLNQSVDGLSGRFIREIKPHVRLIVGQHAATVLPEEEDYGGYDLMVSSFPATVDWCRRRGLRALLSRLAFEPRVLSYLKPTGKEFELTFAGSLFTVHGSRQRMLESLCDEFPQLKVWTPGRDRIPPSSPLRTRYAGTVWGREMYQVLHSSTMTLNHHGDVAPYANNLRLFEATGVGTFLVTDWKENLSDLFEPGKELVAYRSPGECADLIRYYLAHDDERDAIAQAGQKRTCRDHTYANRMKEFADVVRRYV